jgi:hypothetical protein
VGIRLSPHTIKGFSCSLYGQIDILTAGGHSFAYRFLSSRIDDIKELTAFGVDKLSVNEKFSSDSSEFLQVLTHRYVNIINFRNTQQIFKYFGGFILSDL